MGRPKQLEPWGNTTLLGYLLERVRKFPVDEVWVVIGAESERILNEVDLTGCGVVENPEWEEGLASSLRVGLDALTRLSKAEAALVLLGDQPDVSGEVVETLVGLRRQGGRPVLVPKYRYTWGNPVLVDRSLWPHLMALTGDEGAKRLLRAHPEWVKEVWFEQLPPRDIDTSADVEELRPRS